MHEQTKTSNPDTYSRWEEEVVELISIALEISYSDASGVVEAQPFYMAQAWAQERTPAEVAGKVLAASGVALEPAQASPATH